MNEHDCFKFFAGSELFVGFFGGRWGVLVKNKYDLFPPQTWGSSKCCNLHWSHGTSLECPGVGDADEDLGKLAWVSSRSGLRKIWLQIWG
jgi:hypothetical protein